MLDFDRVRTACVIDALRGGGNNDQADRETAARITGRCPDAPQMLKWCDRFAVAAAAAAVTDGVAGVIFGGLGFPVPVSPHRAVLARGTGRSLGRRRTWFAYADGAAAVASARGMALEGDDSMPVVLKAPVTSPEAVLSAARAARVPGGPLQVQLGLSAAFLDGAEMGALTARWASLLPPGSRVALLAPLDGYLCLPELASPVPAHQPGDAEAWLKGAGLELVRPAADVRAWERPGWDEQAIRLDSSTRVVAAVGRSA